MFQKRKFFVRGRPTQQRVAVRKTSKSRNHVTMAVGIVQEIVEQRTLIRCHFSRQRLVARYCQVLHLHGLGVFQRQVEKHPFNRCELPVFSQRKGIQAERQRLRVGCKRLPLVAINVMRKLVQHDQKRKPTAGRLGPVVELTGSGSA